MMVTAKIEYGFYIVTDEFGNEMSLSPEYKKLCATFEGKEYSYEGTHWKKDKKGKLSKAFVDWADEMDKVAYEASVNFK